MDLIEFKALPFKHPSTCQVQCYVAHKSATRNHETRLLTTWLHHCHVGKHVYMKRRKNVTHTIYPIVNKTIYYEMIQLRRQSEKTTHSRHKHSNFEREKMSSEVGPWWGGRRGGGDLDWFGRDPWDPQDFGRSWLWDKRPGGGGGATGELRRGEDDPSKLLHTHVDWRETPDAHVIRADLPGVKREEVKVQLEDDNVLEISGERKEEREEGGDTWHRAERRRGMFSRRFRLPENASVDAISCLLENGVLTVTVPKKETPPITRNIRSISVA